MPSHYQESKKNDNPKSVKGAVTTGDDPTTEQADGFSDNDDYKERFNVKSVTKREG